MSFFDRLRMFDIRSFMSAPTRKTLLMAIGDDGESVVPISAAALGGAGATPLPGGASLTPLSRQTLTLTGAAQGLTVPPDALAARISVRGGDASVAYASPDPTPDSGDLWAEGSLWELAETELSAVRAVSASGSPVLQVTYLGVGAS